MTSWYLLNTDKDQIRITKDRNQFYIFHYAYKYNQSGDKEREKEILVQMLEPKILQTLYTSDSKELGRTLNGIQLK